MQNEILSKVNQKTIKPNLPSVNIGDKVIVSFIISESQGSKTKQRIQKFEGYVIKKLGSGPNETINVRKISYGIGVEKTFFLNSPLVTDIQVLNQSKVRRAKLYYLRNLRGKKAKLKKK